MTAAQAPAGWRAVSRLYNALMTGLVLTLMSRAGEAEAARFVFTHFRRQHLQKFLPGLEKLGLTALPDAVACAQYHYFSNALGGVKTEFIPETDMKAWVRYPPPRWIWQGAAICAVPASVNEAMLHGWHGHNGVTLDNPRLGFVCTGQTVGGAPGLEGYYLDYGRDIAPQERVRFVSTERAPRFDPDRAPKLASADWPPERLDKVQRSYAMEYVRSLIPAMHELFGSGGTLTYLGRAARLIGMQFHDDLSEALGATAGGTLGLAELLLRLAQAQGETASIASTATGLEVRQSGWRMMRDIAVERAGFEAWAELHVGLAAVRDRDLDLRAERDGEDVIWRIRG